MFKSIKKYWQLFWQFRKVEFMRTVEYRGDFFFWTFISIMWTVFNYFFFGLLTQVGNGIGGWNIDEMYVLLSIFTMLDAFTWSFFFHNMRLYTESVFNGEISKILLKPVNSQFVIMTQANSYSNAFRFLIGAFVLVRTVNKIGLSPTWWQILLFLLVLLAAFALIYFLWFSFSTLALWVEKLDNINEIVPAFRRLWQVPKSVYAGITSVIFTIVVPVGLISSLPSEVILGKATAGWILYLLVFTTAIIIFSRWFFKYSIKKFVGVGN